MKIAASAALAERYMPGKPKPGQVAVCSLILLARAFLPLRRYQIVVDTDGVHIAILSCNKVHIHAASAEAAGNMTSSFNS